MLALFLLPANAPGLDWEQKYWLFGKISQQTHKFQQEFMDFFGQKWRWVQWH